MTVAILGLDELCANNRSAERRPWVARITALDPKRGFERRFIDGSRDYRDTDKKGRGTKVYFTLEAGYLYEVNRWRARYKEERYFVRIAADGEIVGVRQEDVTRILEDAQCTRDERIRQSLAALDAQVSASSVSTS
jgi:hypothetical protein